MGGCPFPSRISGVLVLVSCSVVYHIVCTRACPLLRYLRVRRRGRHCRRVWVCHHPAPSPTSSIDSLPLPTHTSPPLVRVGRIVRVALCALFRMKNDEEVQLYSSLCVQVYNGPCRRLPPLRVVPRLGLLHRPGRAHKPAAGRERGDLHRRPKQRKGMKRRKARRAHHTASHVAS